MTRQAAARILPFLLGAGLLAAVVVGAQASGQRETAAPVSFPAFSEALLPVRRDGSLSLTQAVFLPLVSLERPPYVMRINVGGPTFTTTRGIVYQADQPYTPQSKAGYVQAGNPVNWYNALAHPMGGIPKGDKWLYADARTDFDEYRFDLLAGEYLVTLQMAALNEHTSGQRVFDVSIESSPVLTAFDLFAEANLWYAVEIPTPVLVTDGQLNVVFSPTVGSSLLNAIKVTSQKEEAITSTAPAQVQATGCFDRILVDWQASSEPTALGYQVQRSTRISDSLQVITSSLRYVPYYLDEDVQAGQIYSYTVRTRDVEDRSSEVSAAVTATLLPPTSTALPVYELIIAPEDLEQLNSNPWSDDYVPGVLKYAGKIYDVQVRYRGGWTTRNPPKKSWKIRFPETQLFHGNQILNLNAEFNDAYLIKENLVYDLFHLFDVDGPQAELVHLRLNNQFWGIYTQVEHVDEYFLLRSDRPVGSTIYKVNMGGDYRLQDDPNQYAIIYEKRTNQSSGHNELIAFLELINNTPDDQFPTKISQVFEVASYLHYYGTVILSGNLDVMEYYHNSFLIHDSEAERWEVVPWDNGAAFFDPSLPIDHGTPGHVLLTRLLDVPEFRLYYGRFLIEAMEKEYSPEYVGTMVDDYHTLLGPASGCDVWHRYWWGAELPSPTGFVERRNAYLKSVVYDFMEGLTMPLTLALDPLDHRLILHNQGLLDWNVGGLTVRTWGGEGENWSLPDNTVVPAQGSLVLCNGQSDATSLLPITDAALSQAARIELLDKPLYGYARIAEWTRKADVNSTGNDSAHTVSLH